MKIVFKPINKAMRLLALPLVLGIICAPQSVQAWSNTLTNGNSSVTIGADTPHGMSDWTVDGQTQLYKQWFWYRKGMTKPENPINMLASSAVQTSPNVLNTFYSGSAFSIEITYSLLGGAFGSGSSAVGEQIKITNLTADPLDFHFFQYVDFDLGGDYLGDTVYLEQNLQGMFEKAYQTKGNAYFADEIVSPAANHGEVGLSQSILTKLNDSYATTLNDSVGPVTGDAVWGFQWDVLIDGHDSFYIDINKSVYVTPVPEPTGVALFSLGVILVGLARRHSSSRK